MAHKTVVRNKAYQTSSFNKVERHNERKNEEYLYPSRTYSFAVA